MVVDYRKLNTSIEVDSVPLPDLHSASIGSVRRGILPSLASTLHITRFRLLKKVGPIRHSVFCEICISTHEFPWATQTLTRLLDTVFYAVKFNFVFNYLDD